jgi:hypothetical protein
VGDIKTLLMAAVARKKCPDAPSATDAPAPSDVVIGGSSTAAEDEEGSSALDPPPENKKKICPIGTPGCPKKNDDDNSAVEDVIADTGGSGRAEGLTTANQDEKALQASLQTLLSRYFGGKVSSSIYSYLYINVFHIRKRVKGYLGEIYNIVTGDFSLFFLIPQGLFGGFSL